MNNIYLLSFYTEGGETDKGYELKNIAASIKQKLSPYFTDIFTFNKKELKALPNSENVCNEFEEALDMNPNANYIGYFDFKSFLISHILKQIPEDSILIYHDSNFEKNAQYWESDWPNIYKLCETVLGHNDSDIFCQFERDNVLVKEYVKTHTIDTVITDPTENGLIKNCYLINAARIILRNTPFSRQFIKEYGDLCADKTLLSKHPNDNPDPSFKWSCGDQDVLNCLIYKYILDGKLKPTFPIFSFLYRILRFENRPFNWIGQNWNPHPTGASTLSNSALIDYLKRKFSC